MLTKVQGVLSPRLVTIIGRHFWDNGFATVGRIAGNLLDPNHMPLRAPQTCVRPAERGNSLALSFGAGLKRNDVVNEAVLENGFLIAPSEAVIVDQLAKHRNGAIPILHAGPIPLLVILFLRDGAAILVVAIDGTAAEEVINHVKRLNVVVRVRKEFDADHGADDRVAVAAVERRFAREIHSGAKRRVLRGRSEGHRWRRGSDENGGRSETLTHFTCCVWFDWAFAERAVRPAPCWPTEMVEQQR